MHAVDQFCQNRVGVFFSIKSCNRKFLLERCLAAMRTGQTRAGGQLFINL